MADPTRQNDRATEVLPGPDQAPTLAPSAVGANAIEYPQIGNAVPGYEIERELGRGGMGVVYKARQIGLDRLCALKMILSGGHASQDDLARFRSEAQAVARLQHPNIVQIFEVGECAGQPYFSMEFCPGGALDQKLAGTPLPPDEAACLVRALALAMQAAHEAKVVHRDLKPANVLLGADGTPKITDFGLAKKLDDASGKTQTGAILGTPSYMAPEQAESRKDVGPAADIYSLGAILYECLTGRPPFRAPTPLDTVLQVISQDPVAPRFLNPLVPHGLETIALKCLSKHPGSRYPSAAELANDLGRHLAGEPILARPARVWERLASWTWRHPTVAGLIGLTIFLTVVGIIGISWGWYVASQQAHLARQAQDQAETHLYFSRIALAERELSTGNVARAGEVLDGCSRSRARWEWRYLSRQVEGGTAWHWPGEWASEIAWLDDRRLAIGTDEGRVEVREMPSGKPLGQSHTTGPVARILPIPGLGLLALDGRGRQSEWRPGAGGPFREIVEAGPLDVAGAGNGFRVAGFDDGKVRLIGEKGVSRTWDVLTSPAHRVAISANGRVVAALAYDSGAAWDAEKGTRLLHWAGEGGAPASALALAPTGDRLALATAAGVVRIVGLPDGKDRVAVRVAALDVAFSPSGQSFATAGADNVVRIWDPGAGQELLALRGHTDRVLRVAFSPDGRWLASAGADGAVRLWDARDGQAARVLRRHDDTVFALAVHPHDPIVASVGADRRLVLWRLNDGSGEHSRILHRDVISSVAFSPKGDRLVTGSWDGTVQVGAGDGQGEPITLAGHEGQVTSVAFHPDRPVVASGGYDRSVRLWPLEGRREPLVLSGHEDDVWSVAFSPDGNWLASGSWDRTIRIWDANTGDHLRTLAGHSAAVLSVAFSPKGGLLASAGMDHLVRLWDPATGEPRGVLRGHTDTLFHVGFSPSGERLVSAGADRTIRIWDVKTGELALTLAGHTDLVRQAVFTSDDRYLVSCGRDRTVRVWDAGPVGRLPGGPDDGSLTRLLGRLAASGAAWRRDRIAALEQSEVPAELRERARRSLGWELDSPERLNAAAWQTALHPNRPAGEYLRAMTLAEGARRLQPVEARYLNTLAVALYRAGRYREAHTCARASMALDRAQGRSDTSFNLAVMALASHQRKDAAEAQGWLMKLRSRLEADRKTGDPDARLLANEALRVVGKRPPENNE